jgi:hypothetical protein
LSYFGAGMEAAPDSIYSVIHMKNGLRENSRDIVGFQTQKR